MASPRHLFCATNAGLDWGPYNPLYPDQALFEWVPEFAQSAGDPNVIYASNEIGIFRTLDGGATWYFDERRETQSPWCHPDPSKSAGCGPPWDACTLGGGSGCPGADCNERCGRLNVMCGAITQIHVDPDFDDTVYAATERGLWKWQYPFGPGSCYPIDPACSCAGPPPKRCLSDNAAGWSGETWTRLQPACPPPPGPCVNDLYFLSIARNPAVATNFLAGGRDGLYESLDGGSTWVKVPEVASTPVHKIRFGEGGTVFLATDEGVYRRPSSGTFSLTLSGPPGVKYPAVDVALYQGGAVTAYAAVMDYDEDTFNEGIYRSDDGGLNWKKVVTSADNQKAMSVFVKDGGTSDGKVWAGVLGGGLRSLEAPPSVVCDRLQSDLSNGPATGNILHGSALTSVGDMSEDPITFPKDCESEWAAVEFQPSPLQARVRVYGKNVTLPRGPGAPFGPSVSLSIAWAPIQGVGDPAENCPDVALGLPFPAGAVPPSVQLLDACSGAPGTPLQESTGRYGFSLARSGNYLAVGAPDTTAPRVYVYQLDALPVPVRVIDSPPQSAQEDFGWSLAWGDMNGDGFVDLAVGAPAADLTGTGAVSILGNGRVYIYSGATAWTTLLATLTPGAPGVVGFGFSLSSGYDRKGPGGNPDGKADLVVGAPAMNGRGAAFWYANDVDTSPLVVNGETLGDRFGFSVLMAQDLTGDLLPDALVGAPDFPPTTRDGAVYLYEGTGAMSCRQTGTIPDAEFGWALAEAGDVDKNRFRDVLIGQPDEPESVPLPGGPGTAFLRLVLR